MVVFPVDKPFAKHTDVQPVWHQQSRLALFIVAKILFFLRLYSLAPLWLPITIRHKRREPQETWVHTGPAYHNYVRFPTPPRPDCVSLPSFGVNMWSARLWGGNQIIKVPLLLSTFNGTNAHFPIKTLGCSTCMSYNRLHITLANHSLIAFWVIHRMRAHSQISSGILLNGVFKRQHVIQRMLRMNTVEKRRLSLAALKIHWCRQQEGRL